MADPRAALDRALLQENLVLLYQPIHDAVTGTVRAAEALLRQRRESGELREAGIITDAAEEAPRRDLVALETWTLHTAWAAAARWQRGAAPGVDLQVNISSRTLEEGGIIGRLHGMVASCAIDVRKVRLEMTETYFVDKPERTRRTIEQIRELGLEVWLDDFGTGYSTVSHLLEFPVDGMKIPADFVKRLPHDRTSRAIAGALLSLARELGLPVIAEGVERKEQLDFLRDHRCDLIQGFYFSRPLTEEDFVRALTEGARIEN